MESDWRIINFTSEDTRFITENLDNHAEILSKMDVNSVLKAIDDFIIQFGFDIDPEIDEQVLNDIGRKTQRVYDRIYENN